MANNNNNNTCLDLYNIILLKTQCYNIDIHTGLFAYIIKYWSTSLINRETEP